MYVRTTLKRRRRSVVASKGVLLVNCRHHLRNMNWKTNIKAVIYFSRKHFANTLAPWKLRWLETIFWEIQIMYRVVSEPLQFDGNWKLHLQKWHTSVFFCTGDHLSVVLFLCYQYMLLGIISFALCQDYCVKIIPKNWSGLAGGLSCVFRRLAFSAPLRPK